MWQYDNTDWESYVSESSNTSDNWVEASGFAFFQTLTLAENMAQLLPIEIIHFDAIVNEDKNVNLNWTTATEINNDYFTIERSKDGVQFEQIEDIQGAGNSLQIRDYKTLDPNPYSGVSYYRLLQTDFDGTQSHSEIRAVNIQLNQKYSIYPNPLQEVLHIVGKTSRKGKITIEIFDVLGRTVYSNHIEMGEDVNSIEISEVSLFEAGNYFLTIRTIDETVNFNLVKVRE